MFTVDGSVSPLVSISKWHPDLKMENKRKKKKSIRNVSPFLILSYMSDNMQIQRLVVLVFELTATSRMCAERLVRFSLGAELQNVWNRSWTTASIRRQRLASGETNSICPDSSIF
jgi:hypothetical protein